MLKEDNIINILASVKDRRLTSLAIINELVQPAKTADIRTRGFELGRRDILAWNLSDILKKAAGAGLVVQLPDGWKMLPAGLLMLKQAGIIKEAPIVALARHQLHKHLTTVSDPNRREFLQEALGNFDNGHYRSAVVLSWVGAASIIQVHVANNFLVQFNSAGLKRFSGFKAAKNAKDLSSLPESELLQLCQDCGMLDKAEKQELQARLDLRNRCGHPNSLKLRSIRLQAI